MFSLVKAAHFLLFSYAETHGLLDDEEDEACCSEARDSVGEDANSLSAESVVTSHIEDTDSERTPDTVDEVDGESTDRVVQVQAVKRSNMKTAPTTSTPAIAPIIQEESGVTTSAPAVIATRPARHPLRAMVASGFLETIQLVSVAVMMPATAARFVVTRIQLVAFGSPLRAEPALNPHQPNQSMNTPIVASGML